VSRSTAPGGAGAPPRRGGGVQGTRREEDVEEVTLTAESGRPTGSRASRRLRLSGKVPAVLYGHGIDPVSLAVDQRALRNALTGAAGLNALITLDVAGQRHLAMARYLQRDPIKGTVHHVDFVIVRRDEVVAA